MNISRKNQEGQSLVLILVVLVVGAIIAFAIAARTIQDIRRTGEERISNQAATQVETILDVTTSEGVWSQIWDGTNFLINETIDCIGGSLEPNCCLTEDAIDTYLGYEVGGECDGGFNICIRLEDGIVDKYIEKDNVYEINLSQASASGSFSLFWNPDNVASGRLIVKVYESDGSGGVVLGNQVFGLCDPESGCDGWGTPSASAVISYDPGVELFVRVRAIGSGATIWTSGDIPPQELSILSSCQISGIYREFIRSVPLHSYLPACFDYVLFDGSTMVENFDSF